MLSPLLANNPEHLAKRECVPRKIRFVRGYLVESRKGQILPVIHFDQSPASWLPQAEIAQFRCISMRETGVETHTPK